MIIKSLSKQLPDPSNYQPWPAPASKDLLRAYREYQTPSFWKVSKKLLQTCRRRTRAVWFFSLFIVSLAESLFSFSFRNRPSCEISQLIASSSANGQKFRCIELLSLTSNHCVKPCVCSRRDSCRSGGSNECSFLLLRTLFVRSVVLNSFVMNVITTRELRFHVVYAHENVLQLPESFRCFANVSAWK